MFDIIYRNVFTPEYLRERRREDQVNRLQRATDNILKVSSKNVKTLDSDKVKEFIQDIIQEKSETPSIVGIKGTEDGNDLVLILQDGSDTIHVPLVNFGQELATAFEQKLTSTALCFVADASSGLGSEMLAQIASSCGAGMVRTVRLHICTQNRSITLTS